MKELLSLIPLLQKASSNTVYPLTSKYIVSTGEKTITYNGEALIVLDYELPFVGGVNIYVLSNILKNLSEDFLFDVDGNKLQFTDGNYHGSLIIDQFDLHDIQEVLERYKDVELIGLTEKVIDAIKCALKFTGSEDNKYVILKNDLIFGTNGKKLFYNQNPIINTVDRILINSKVASMLDTTCQIGTLNDNTVIKFDKGLMIQTNTSIYKFNMAGVLGFIDSLTNKELNSICDFKNIQDGVNKLFPMSIGEGAFNVEITVGDIGILITYVSIANGVAKYKIDKMCDYIGDTIISGNDLKSIQDKDYKLFIDSGRGDLILKNDQNYNIALINRRSHEE